MADQKISDNHSITGMPKSVERKTLLNAFAKLETVLNKLEGLNTNSVTLIEKFNRTEGCVEDVCFEKNPEQVEPHLDLIDLFYDISDRMEEKIYCINGNLESVISLIE